MSIPYERHKEIIEQKRSELIAELQPEISARNVRRVHNLSGTAQATLAEVIQAGVSQLSAIRMLEQDPDLSTKRLMSGGQDPGKQEGATAKNLVEPASPPAKTLEDAEELIYHLLTSGAVSNEPEAEGVAQSAYMAGVLGFVMAKRRIWSAENSNTSQVTVAVCQIIIDLHAQMTHLLEEKYHHRMALLQSKVDWEWLSTGDSEAVPQKTDIDVLSAWMYAIGLPAPALTAGVAMEENNARLLDLTAAYRRMMAHDENPATEQATFSTFGRVGFALQVMRDLID